MRWEDTQQCVESQNQERDNLKRKGWPTIAGDASNSNRLRITFEYISVDTVANLGEPEFYGMVEVKPV